MKYLILAFLLINFSLANAQQQDECNNAQMHKELVTLNQSFENQGMKLHYYSMIHLPNKVYVPVSVTFEQGKMYQINFLANPDYQNYSMVLIDQEKNELIKIKVKSRNTEGHLTSQSFMAPRTGNYWLIMMQKVKNSESNCAGLSILESGE